MLANMLYLACLKDRPSFQKISSGSLKNLFQVFFFNFGDNHSQKLWNSHPLPTFSMLVVILLAHSWSRLPGTAFSDLAQYWMREKVNFVYLSNQFFWNIYGCVASKKRNLKQKELANIYCIHFVLRFFDFI